MKNIFLFFSALFAMVILTQSCKKNATVDPTNQTITQELTVNQSYQFDLGSFGEEEGATISRQANNFLTSTVDRDNNTGKAVYKYVPAANFVGTDEVELRSARGSDGASPCNSIINTTIKFIIRN